MGSGTSGDVLWYRKAVDELRYDALIDAWRRSGNPTEGLLAECEDLAWSLRADAGVWADVLGAGPGLVSEYGTQMSRCVSNGNLEEARTMAVAILYVCARVPLADFIVDGVPLRLDADLGRDLREGVQLRQEFRRLLARFDTVRDFDEDNDRGRASPGMDVRLESDTDQEQSGGGNVGQYLRRLFSRRVYRRPPDSPGEEPPNRGPLRL